MLKAGSLTLTFITIILAASAGFGADWPHWRGMNRDGSVTEHSAWDASRPLEQLWESSVGFGASSPVIARGRLYATGWSDGKDTVHCLDAATGEVIWQQSTPSPEYGRYHRGDEAFYKGPSSTPTLDLDAGLLFTLSIDGDLQCRAAEDGRLIWRLNLYDEYKVPMRPDVGGGLRDYGYTSCPLVMGNELLVEVGCEQGNLVAFDKNTGKPLWYSQCRDPAGQSGGPVPIVVDGIPCVVVLTLRNVAVTRIDPGNKGKTLATYPWQTYFANGIATPLVVGDSVVITSGYNISRIARLRVTAGGIRAIWSVPYYSKVCSPVYHEGRVYHAWQKLWCLDWETGEPHWAGGRFGDDSSCVVTADGRLIVLGHGRLVLVDAAGAPESYRELASRDGLLKGYCWPHVTVANGRLYAKNSEGRLLCLRLGS